MCSGFSIQDCLDVDQFFQPEVSNRVERQHACAGERLHVEEPQLKQAWQPERRASEHEGILYQLNDLRPLTGAMAPFLGNRFSMTRLDNEFVEDDERDFLALIRAYPVVSLIGALLSANDELDLRDSLEALLGQHCAGLGWHVRRDVSGPLRKYGILHTSVAAPADETTGQPMALEVFARPAQIGVASWVALRRERYQDDYTDAPVDEPIELQMRAAT
jgi:hypothetical protein